MLQLNFSTFTNCSHNFATRNISYLMHVFYYITFSWPKALLENKNTTGIALTPNRNVEPLDNLLTFKIERFWNTARN